MCTSAALEKGLSDDLPFPTACGTVQRAYSWQLKESGFHAGESTLGINLIHLRGMHSGAPVLMNGFDQPLLVLTLPEARREAPRGSGIAACILFITVPAASLQDFRPWAGWRVWFASKK